MESCPLFRLSSIKLELKAAQLLLLLCARKKSSAARNTKTYTHVNTQVLQFPPALYHYITGELQKQVVLVLNKVDLCPPPLVIAWKHYMTSQFPHLQMVCFTSHPGQPYSTGEQGQVQMRGGHAICVISRRLNDTHYQQALVVFLLACSAPEEEDEEECWLESSWRSYRNPESLSGDHSRERWASSPVLHSRYVS